jgi:hypothetical protein
MHIFARLTKVDEAQRTVTGVIANEALDHSGEIFDYDRSKPHFEQWSTDVAKATDGKNLGNVRAMHGNISAGITKTMDFNDLEKQISVVAEITDDNEWRKVLKGNYTGFSIGGSYVEKWPDPALGKTRYEAKPYEYSLVDLPCNPDAQFSVIKSDGAEEMRKFETTTDTEALAKWADRLDENEISNLTDVLLKIAVRNEAASEPITPPGDLSKSATSPEEDAMNDELQKSLTTAQADLAKAADDLAKVSGERDDLKKALDTAATELAARDELLMKAATALDERNAVIEKFKNAPAPVKAALLAISKGEDIGTDLPEVDKVKKADGTVDEAATEIKKALMNPVFTR